MSEEGNETRRRRRRPRRRPRGGKGPARDEGGQAGERRPDGEREAGAASESRSGNRREGNGADARGQRRESGGNGSQGKRRDDAADSQGERREGNGGGRNRSGRQPGRGRGRGGRPQRGQQGRNRPRRGRVAENWWARRWIEVLEKFAVGRRLGRGRTYARQGNIVDLEIGKGFVTAHVQGSRDAPYLVRMHFSMLSSTDWKKISRALIAQPEIAVELGMGQIPSSIEGVFEEQNLSLFPNASGDLKAACSCPDNANPCKHVAAVYYLLGEEFDRDPFLIFQLRGMERSELMQALGPAAIPRPPAPPPPPERPSHAESEDGEEGEWLDAAPIPDVIEPLPERVIPDEPLPADPAVFWGGARRPHDEEVEVRIPRTPGAIVARLGGFPFWRGQSNCEAAMARIYRNASIAGLDAFLGTGEIGEDEES